MKVGIATTNKTKNTIPNKAGKKISKLENIEIN